MIIQNNLYEIRRGSICELLGKSEQLSSDAASWMSENKEACERLFSTNPRYMLVMKCIDEENILTAPVYEKQLRNTKGIRINGQKFWVKFAEFVPMPVSMVIPACGKMLDHPGVTITAIYETHRITKSRGWRIRQKCADEERIFKRNRKGRECYAG